LTQWLLRKSCTQKNDPHQYFEVILSGIWGKSPPHTAVTHVTENAPDRLMSFSTPLVANPGGHQRNATSGPISTKMEYPNFAILAIQPASPTSLCNAHCRRHSRDSRSRPTTSPSTRPTEASRCSRWPCHTRPRPTPRTSQRTPASSQSSRRASPLACPRGSPSAAEPHPIGTPWCSPIQGHKVPYNSSLPSFCPRGGIKEGAGFLRPPSDLHFH
jgi:hypothetical protein